MSFGPSMYSIIVAKVGKGIKVLIRVGICIGIILNIISLVYRGEKVIKLLLRLELLLGLGLWLIFSIITRLVFINLILIVKYGTHCIVGIRRTLISHHREPFIHIHVVISVHWYVEVFPLIESQRRIENVCIILCFSILKSKIIVHVQAPHMLLLFLRQYTSYTATLCLLNSRIMMNSSSRIIILERPLS